MRLIARCASTCESPDWDLTLISRPATRKYVVFELAVGSNRSGNPSSKRTAAFGWTTKTNPLSQEPLSAGSLCLLSNTGRTTTGRHHEENSFSDGCYSRVHCAFVRARQNCRSSAAIRCFLVLRGSGYRNDEMSSYQCAACRWWQHEGYRCRSSDTSISGNSFDGRQDLHQVMT
jgi:hypothetical protein